MEVGRHLSRFRLAMAASGQLACELRKHWTGCAEPEPEDTHQRDVRSGNAAVAGEAGGPAAGTGSRSTCHR